MSAESNNFALASTPAPRAAANVAEVMPVRETFEAPPITTGAVPREIRVHHWVKNLLIFLPVAATHRLFPLDWLGRAMLAIAGFSICASSIYVLNDLQDLTRDREHPEKKDRMLASRQIRPAVALEMVGLLLLGAVAFCVGLPITFSVLLGTYFLLMMGYSLGLKKIPILDVVILSAGYVLRVVAGAAATGVALSPWTPAVVALLFGSFTLVKRCGELKRQASIKGAASVQLYGYVGGNIRIMMAAGISSGYLAIVMLAVHADSEIAQALFPRRELFWGLFALLIF